jgi:hypothetical protein
MVGAGGAATVGAGAVTTAGVGVGGNGTIVPVAAPTGCPTAGVGGTTAVGGCRAAGAWMTAGIMAGGAAIA